MTTNNTNAVPKGQQVEVTRKLLPAPDIADPERKVYQIMYRAGNLPPHFIIIPEKGYTKEKEAKLIKEDIQKQMTMPRETITL